MFSNTIANLVVIMKTSRKLLFLGMIVLLSSLIVGTATTQAKHVNATINFEYVYDSYGDPLKFWYDKDGVYHAIKTPHYGHILAGDIEGDIYYNGNVVLDFTTFSGKGGGIIEFTGTYNDEVAGFRGKLIFTIEFGVVTGTMNCPGTGAFANLLLKGTFTAALGGSTFVNMVIWNK